MDLEFTAEETAFRDEVRAFLAAQLPAALSDKVLRGRPLTREDMAGWHAVLNRRGWLASHWPVEYGGTGWSSTQKFIFDNECALAGAPRIVPFGLSMLGPVLIKYGSEAQKRHWLPRILDGTDWWCQGYSEPGAGSDLAAVQTTAVRDGDDYIVNGQKTWTTLGHYANMIFCLVRTSHEGRRQEGISFLLIDMRSPGVEVRPIITLDGEHEVNEVFFSNVRVPAANLVGEENRGWTCAKYLLTYERTNIAGVGQSTAALARLKAVAARQRRNGRPLADDPTSPRAWRGWRSNWPTCAPPTCAWWPPSRRRRAGRGKLDAEDTRHPDPPGNHRAEPPRHGSLCPGRRRRDAAWRRHAHRAGRRRHRLGAILQQPQAVDLRRLQ